MQPLFAIALATTFWLTFPGCGRTSHNEWEIDVNNKTTATCSVRVDMDFANGGIQQTSEAHIDVLKAGEKLTLLSGNLPTMIRSIKVTSGDKVQTLIPAVQIQPGQTYRIVLPAEGPPQAAFD